ncbi:IS1182 family transposase [Clostridium sp. UBA1652]|uniref:IS1182 family transposase n=1 Tax=Clostridium sp. UBA1652 TaxID=1946348 RepID=UPI00257BD8F6|nr:IS1182 family transposase [Clostridium sp. UBA1652]
MNYICGDDRTQIRIESMEEFVEKYSEVRVIDKIVDSMNLECLGFNIGNNDAIGRPKFDPKDLLKLYIYGYFNGIRSSRKLAKQCVINREVIWLIKGLKPKYRVIADFRKDNIEALEEVFKSFVNYCIKLGLYGKELIVVDGTKLEASASKRKHYSKNKLAKMKKIAQDKIKEYLHEVEMNDKIDDKNSSLDKTSIPNAIEELEEKIAYYDDLEAMLIENDMNEINFTDSDAKTVKFGANQGTDVGYNVQSAVDAENKLIVTFEVGNNSPDQGQLHNVSKKAKDILEIETIEVLADKGYFAAEDLAKCEEDDITSYVSRPRYTNSSGDSRYFIDKFKYIKEDDVYICPDGEILHCHTKKVDAKRREYYNFDACKNCENKDKCTTAKDGRKIARTEGDEIAEIVDKRVKENQEKYKQRQMIVEHPFGTIKRTMGFYHLLLRGFKKVRGEVSIAFFTYNLKRVINILGTEKFLEALISKIYFIILKKYTLAIIAS